MITKEDLELEQYRSLRDEILRAMEDGNQIMSFGLAAIGIVLTAGLQVRDAALGFFMFAIIVPCLSSLVLSMWFAAQERIARASYFITGIESRLKHDLKALSTPTWDSWLRTPSKRCASQHHFWNTEYSGIGIFAFLIFGPVLLSLFTGGLALRWRWKISIVVAAIVAFAAFFYWIRKRVRRWRDWLASDFGDLE